MIGGMPSQWFRPCGRGYRWHENGQIEVEGMGFPEAPGDAKTIVKIWTEWGAAITKAAKKVNCPPSWIVGIILIETRGESGPKSFAPCNEGCGFAWRAGRCASQGGDMKYCAGGIMAFLDSTAQMYGHTIDYYVDHPEQMIEDGADLLVNKKTKGGNILVGVKQYNGGTACSGEGQKYNTTPGIMGMWGQGNYPEHWLRVCNTFVALGLAPPAASASMGGTAGNVLVLLAVGGLTWWALQSTGVGKRIVSGLRL